MHKAAAAAPEFGSFALPVRVYYEDTDAGGVVYHSNYLKFMERARTEWLRRLGFEQLSLAQTIGVLFTVHRMTIDFLRPARLDAELVVTTTVSQLRQASVEFDQRIGDAAGASYCNARVLVACVDAKSFKPVAMPRGIIEELRSGK